MPVCSYLVIPATGEGDEVARALVDLPGCDVTRATNRDVLLLVTDTPGPEEDEALRQCLESMEGIRALVLAFGEIDPDTPQADPLARGRRRKGSRLPVMNPGQLRDLDPGAGRPTSGSEAP